MDVTLSENDLRIIKKIELEIALEIKRICEENNINYSLSGGTLIGAVRHKGFIPWDDDIDMAMTRENYDKFLKIAPEKIDGNRFYIVNYETDPNVGEPFTKVMRKGTVFQESFSENTNASNGVFVDLFPFDNAPDGKLARRRHAYRAYSIRKRILIKSGYNFQKTGVKKLIYKLIGATTFSGKEKLVKRFRKNQTKYNNINTKSMVSICGAYSYDLETVPAEMLEGYTQLEFEGEKFSVFKEYDIFLRHYFNDYMQLPPEEERINKHTLASIDLSLYGGTKTK